MERFLLNKIFPFNWVVIFLKSPNLVPKFCHFSTLKNNFFVDFFVAQASNDNALSFEKSRALIGQTVFS